MRTIYAIAFLLMGMSVIPSPAQDYVMSTYVGGAPPPTPLPGITLAIRNPQGLAIDAAGNTYFATLNCVFRLGQMAL